MKPTVILKVAILLVMLLIVVSIMRNMNEQSAAKLFSNLGIDPKASSAGGGTSAPEQPLGANQSNFNICKTRVHAVVWPDGRRIEESREQIKAHWLAVDPTPREIGSLDVEKWFSRHCQIAIVEDEASRAARDGFNNFVTFEFIDGTKADFQRTESGVFRAEGDRQFRSDDFDKAIAELIGLAQLQPVGP